MVGGEQRVQIVQLANFQLRGRLHVHHVAQELIQVQKLQAVQRVLMAGFRQLNKLLVQHVLQEDTQIKQDKIVSIAVTEHNQAQVHIYHQVVQIVHQDIIQVLLQDIFVKHAPLEHSQVMPMVILYQPVQ
jgi:hypothetical protein